MGEYHPRVYAAPRPAAEAKRPNIPGANAAGTATALRVVCAGRVAGTKRVPCEIEPCGKAKCLECSAAKVIDEMAQELASLRDKLYGKRGFRT